MKEKTTILSVLLRNGSHTVIDMITVGLDIKKKTYGELAYSFLNTQVDDPHEMERVNVGMR